MDGESGWILVARRVAADNYSRARVNRASSYSLISEKAPANSIAEAEYRQQKSEASASLLPIA